ncbi:MAG: CPBP family intramembrane metalloprotease [Myxococcales bacterium]|nr:CPBP family intramembrane metalloprotease [Myxococcales bacterium]
MALPRIAVLVLCFVIPAVAYRLGGTNLWLGYGVGYTLAAALAAWSLAQDGELRAALAPRAGDPTWAVGGAAVLFLALSAIMLKVVAPLAPLQICTADGAWVGPPEPRGFTVVTEWLRDHACVAFARSAAFRGGRRALAIVAIAALEEVAWRGGVQTLVAEKFGSTRGVFITAALFALAQLTTGNPAVALLALPTGLLFGALMRWRGTVFPAMLAHVVFSFFFFYQNSPLSMRAGAL